jgi:hypothetical protein
VVRPPRISFHGLAGFLLAAPRLGVPLVCNDSRFQAARRQRRAPSSFPIRAPGQLRNHGRCGNPAFSGKRRVSYLRAYD